MNKKKIFAVLMSVMTLVTFMPTMAFADVYQDHITLKDGHYINNYAQYQVTLDYTVPADKADETLTVDTTRTFDTHSGRVTANAHDAVFAELDGAVVIGDVNAVRYYDVTGATFTGSNGVATAEVYADDYIAMETNADGTFVTNPFGNRIKLVKPNYVSGDASSVVKDFNSVKSIKTGVTKAAYEVYSDATLTLPTTMTKSGLGDALDVIGTPATQTLKVVSGLGLDNVTMKFDTREAEAFGNRTYHTPIVYDGNVHPFTVVTKGVKVEYAQAKDASGAAIASGDLVWTSEAPVIKNVGEYDFFVKVSKEYTHISNSVVAEIKATVTKGNVKYGFAQDAWTLHLGEVVIPTDLMKVEGVASSEVDAVNTFIDNHFTVVDMPTRIGRSIVTFKYTAPTTDEMKDITVKHIVDTYTFVATGKTSAEITLVEPVVNKITASKTVTVKAKAKKKVTKQLEASADNGVVVFTKTSGNKKITVSSTGKVTVKKGLKKGKTYTVKVKVSVPASNGFTGATKTMTVKVKVK